MIAFLCGLLVGVGLGSVLTVLLFYRVMPEVIQRAYREDWLKPGPAAFAEAAKQRERRA